MIFQVSKDGNCMENVTIGDLYYSVIYYNYQNVLLTFFCTAISTNCSVISKVNKNLNMKDNLQRMLEVVVK